MLRPYRTLARILAAIAVCGAFPVAAAAQDTRIFERDLTPRKPSPVERLGADVLRIGEVVVNTAKQEVTATGVVTDAVTLEFIAVKKDGYKRYESAIELDTNAINFNTALILAGLDPSRATLPRFHLDPDSPKGDPVEVLVEWTEAGRRRSVRAEELVYNEVSKKTLAPGPWVYTGSAFEAGTTAYLAEVDGPLIGFVHTPATIIDSPRPLEQGAYGSNRINPALNLKPGTAVTVTVRALPRDSKTAAPAAK